MRASAMKWKREWMASRCTWKQFIKVALTLSVGVGLKWSCDEIEQKYYPTTEIVYQDTMFVPLPFMDTVFVAAAPDTIVRMVMLEPGPYVDTVRYAIPFVDTVTIYDHVAIVDTVPWVEPKPVNPNGWKINPRRP